MNHGVAKAPVHQSAEVISFGFQDARELSGGIIAPADHIVFVGKATEERIERLQRVGLA